MTWLILLLAIVSLVTIVTVVMRKLPQVRVVDVTSIPHERERKVKEQILFKKLERASGQRWGTFSHRMGGLLKILSRYGRRAVQKLYRLEQYYQRLRRTATEGTHSYTEEMIDARVEEAWKLIGEEEYIPAEKMLIDLISHNPKCVAGYEHLGNMYIRNGQFDQARETLQFALRLSPDDASVNVSLSELEMKLGNPKAALTSLRQAVDKRPKNPRYLDFYITAALDAGSLKDARRGIQLLKEVNPENQKIVEFEERFQEMKEEYVSRTSTPTPDASQEG